MSSRWNDDNICVLKREFGVLHPIELSFKALSRKDATILSSEAIIDVLIKKLQCMNDDISTSFAESSNKIN